MVFWLLKLSRLESTRPSRSASAGSPGSGAESANKLAGSAEIGADGPSSQSCSSFSSSVQLSEPSAEMPNPTPREAITPTGMSMSAIGRNGMGVEIDGILSVPGKPNRVAVVEALNSRKLRYLAKGPVRLTVPVMDASMLGGLNVMSSSSALPSSASISTFADISNPALRDASRLASTPIDFGSRLRMSPNHSGIEKLPEPGFEYLMES